MKHSWLLLAAALFVLSAVFYPKAKYTVIDYEAEKRRREAEEAWERRLNAHHETAECFLEHWQLNDSRQDEYRLKINKAEFWCSKVLEVPANKAVSIQLAPGVNNYRGKIWVSYNGYHYTQNSSGEISLSRNVVGKGGLLKVIASEVPVELRVYLE